MTAKLLNFTVRWGLLGATLLFLGKTLVTNWHQVRQLHFHSETWIHAGVALTIAVSAQLWWAQVWGWILKVLKYPVPKRWSIVVFLKNSIRKYLPGNVWDMYGRVRAAQQRGIALESATLSVILEPIFVIAGALSLAVLGDSSPGLKALILGLILLAIHPNVLNWIWKWGSQLRGKNSSSVLMQYYPVQVLMGAGLFVGLRSLTFLLVVSAFTPLDQSTYRPVVGGFGLAWFIGLISPVPSGLGVFEVTALNALDDFLAPGLVLGAVALYRVIVIVADLIAATLAYLINEGQEV
uniref:Uncharacterized protein n=1 Tax=Cyanothece sp. (strain PCC 7425 / ATCC 29141) TaxID=395961 RepID=B8HQC7_CYAP4